MRNIVDRLHPHWPKAAFIDIGTWSVGNKGNRRFGDNLYRNGIQIVLFFVRDR